MLHSKPGMKSKIKKLKSKYSKKDLKKKLDDIFSIYIRRRYGDVAKCVTCGKVAEWKKMQCGHYITRAVSILRWDEQNAHVQCYACNVARNGNYPAYARFMIAKYGEDILNLLSAKEKQTKSYSVSELSLLITYYEQRVAALDCKSGSRHHTGAFRLKADLPSSSEVVPPDAP
jgi:hypothetical protein